LCLLRYPNACADRPKTYWDYETFTPTWQCVLQLCSLLVLGLSGALSILRSDQEPYEVVRKIGRGKYSEVFEGLNILTNKPIVIKILKPVKKKKVRTAIVSPRPQFCTARLPARSRFLRTFAEAPTSSRCWTLFGEAGHLS
jgi:serine/threonine protein kinase